MNPGAVTHRSDADPTVVISLAHPAVIEQMMLIGGGERNWYMSVEDLKDVKVDLYCIDHIHQRDSFESVMKVPSFQLRGLILREVSLCTRLTDYSEGVGW